jgi:hypothetical protein
MGLSKRDRYRYSLRTQCGAFAAVTATVCLLLLLQYAHVIESPGCLQIVVHDGVGIELEGAADIDAVGAGKAIPASRARHRTTPKVGGTDLIHNSHVLI